MYSGPKSSKPVDLGEVKACPCCDNKKIFATLGNKATRMPERVECGNCFLTIEGEDAIKKWNTRPDTPSSRWKAEGQPDPHAGHYDVDRRDLCMGHLTDDELANGAFMNYDAPLNPRRILEDKDYHPPIVWMTGVKDRIRWLSRKLEEATNGLQP